MVPQRPSQLRDREGVPVKRHKTPLQATGFTVFQYYQQIEQSSKCFKKSCLEHGVGKDQRASVCDNRREGSTPRKICIYKQKVESVNSFAGMVIDRKLAFSENTGHVCK